MEFNNHGAQPGAQASPAAAPSSRRGHASGDKSKWERVAFVVAIFAVVILILGAIFAITSSNNTDNNQSKYVYTNKLQAVFLNTGQVYFGNIKTLNDKYFVLTNIYYLQTNSSSSTASTSSSANNVSLVKLGCELHQPYDQMVINASEVTFWENLESTGQVAKAVAKFQQENPNGQKCSDQSSSASTTSGTTTQGEGTSSTGSSTTTTP